MVIDDDGAGGIGAELGGVADALHHAGEAVFVDEVGDLFDFVATFEIGEFGGIALLDEGFEGGEDEFGHAAAEDGLFAEEVGFGFVGEGGIDDGGAGAADGIGPGKSEFFSILEGGFLVDGEEAGDAFAALVTHP